MFFRGGIRSLLVKIVIASPPRSECQPRSVWCPDAVTIRASGCKRQPGEHVPFGIHQPEVLVSSGLTAHGDMSSVRGEIPNCDEIFLAGAKQPHCLARFIDPR